MKGDLITLYENCQNEKLTRTKAIGLIRLYKTSIDAKRGFPAGFSRFNFQIDCEKWAINDLLERVLSDPDRTVISIVEGYSLKMEEYACKNLKGTSVFSIASDVAKSVLELLYSYL